MQFPGRKITEVKAKAQKEYRCAWCMEPIKKKEVHLYLTYYDPRHRKKLYYRAHVRHAT